MLAAFILAGAAGWKFLVPYARHSRSAFPKRFGLIIPGLYALGIGLSYAAYASGVPAPPETKWERAAATRPLPEKFGSKTVAVTSE